MKLKVGALALLAVFLGSSFSAAQTTTYNASWNALNGNWNATSDWTCMDPSCPGVYPNNNSTSLFNVTIDPASAATITLNQGITISELTLGSTATLQAASGESLTLAANGTLTNSGNIYFNNGGNSLAIDTGGTLTNNGTMIFYGTSAGNASLTITGTTTNNAGATISLEGTSGFGTTANFTGAVNNYGIFETGLFGGTDTVDVSGTFTNESGGTLNLDSSDKVTFGALSNSGTVIIGPSATLYVGSGLTTIKASSTLTVDGLFYITNTTSFPLASLSTIYGTLELNDGQSNTINNGLTIASGGALYLSNPAASSTTTKLTVSGAVTNSGLVSTGFAGGTNTLKVTGAFTNEAGATLQLAGTNDSVSAESIANSGTINIGTGDTLNVTGSSGLTSVASGSILNISGSFTLAARGASLDSGAERAEVSTGLVSRIGAWRWGRASSGRSKKICGLRTRSWQRRRGIRFMSD